MHFHLDDDEELVIRKVRFCNLLEMLKGERSKNPRRKLFETHLMTSPEKQKKIRKVDKVTRKKEERANQKAKLIKDLLSKNKKKKKVTWKTNTVKARVLPTKPRGRERGRGRGREKTEIPKL